MTCFLVIILYIRDTHGSFTTVSSRINRKTYLKLKDGKKALTKKAEIQQKNTKSEKITGPQMHKRSHMKLEAETKVFPSVEDVVQVSAEKRGRR